MTQISSNTAALSTFLHLSAKIFGSKVFFPVWQCLKMSYLGFPPTPDQTAVLVI